MPLKNSLNDPVGIGIKYPLSFSGGSLRLTASQRVFVSANEGVGDGAEGQSQHLVASDPERLDVVRQSIRRILQVPQGTSFLRGEEGSLVDLVPFEPNDEGTQNLALMYGAVAVADQEERATIKAMSAVQNLQNPEWIDAVLSFQLIGTRITDNLVMFERGDLE